MGETGNYVVFESVDDGYQRLLMLTGVFKPFCPANRTVSLSKLIAALPLQTLKYGSKMSALLIIRQNFD